MARIYINDKTMKLLFTLKDDQFEFNGIKKIRPAARAVVLNNENKIGLLHVYGKDDYFGFRNYYETPGGGIDDNETPKEAAIREVKEEIGGICSEIEEIGIVEDDYNLIFTHNIVYYFLIKVDKFIEKQLLDYEKGWIDEVCWFDIDEAIEKMTNSPDSRLAILQKRREIPILKIAKEMIKNKK